MSSSSGFNFARSHSGDRFYNPPMRRQQLLEQKKQQQVEKKEQQQQVVVQRVMQQLKVTSVKQEEEIDSSSSSPVGTTTNLDRFLESVTPLVTAQYFSKTSMKEWRSGGDGEFHPYFNLEDLWESYKEWSAYGAGVPVMLNETDCVIQYYVPYLSGIQLYVDPSKPPLRVSGSREDQRQCVPSGVNSVGWTGFSESLATFAVNEL
ncbi:hypothetical protein IFM89_003909 [Coptis chinensis]|uniref:Uncharacterized protein n=1 Tax=Coptis chinensis TaxID=261450 RepID=A0A835IJF5_9MAGN|nr:hypothetical protein IFM89_003909 [Coptis chinensis]